MSVQVHLKQFEGPLGLLLYLIKREEMDIYDIPIHLITKQYLEQLKLMSQLDLEVAGDFIAMAATLIHIKSKMLLPSLNAEGEEDEAVDPRKELVQKLLDYQRYKDVSKTLYDRPLLGRDMWTRGSRERHEAEDGEIIIDEQGLYALIASYRKIVRAFSKRDHKVVRQGQSIASRIMELRDRLHMGERTTLKRLLADNEYSREKIVVTFLSILELSRMGFISLFQSDVFGDLYLDPKKDIDRDVISRVEEYDSHEAAAVAERLFQNENEDIEFEVTEEVKNIEPDAISEAVEVATDDEIEEEERALGLPELQEGLEDGSGT